MLKNSPTTSKNTKAWRHHLIKRHPKISPITKLHYLCCSFLLVSNITYAEQDFFKSLNDNELPSSIEMSHALNTFDTKEAHQDSNSDDGLTFDNLITDTTLFSAKSTLNNVNYRHQKVLPSKDEGKDFGSDVAIWGNTAIIADSNAVYAFSRNTDGVWIEKTVLQDHSSEFVKIQQNTALLESEGDLKVLERDTTEQWLVKTILPLPTHTRDIALDENTLVISSQGTGVSTGRVFVYVRDTWGLWREQDQLLSPSTEDIDAFGYSVAITDDTLLIGAVYADTYSITGVKQLDTGLVYEFIRDEHGQWQQNSLLTSHRYRFGSNIELSDDLALVSAAEVPGPIDGGTVYVFERDQAGEWQQTERLTSKPDRELSNNGFGSSLALFDNTAIIGAPTEFEQNDHNAVDSGAAYVYIRDAQRHWRKQAKLIANDASSGDFFGHSVSISEGTALVGAPSHLGNGSAYFFDMKQSSDLVLAVNAGGPAYVSVDKVSFDKDTFGVGRQSIVQQNIAGTLDDTLYQTETWSRNRFQYEIPVNNGVYRVKLHFAEIYEKIIAQDQRVFDVQLEGSTVLADFDIFSETGSQYHAYTKEFFVAVTDGALSLSTSSQVQSPQISAFEIWTTAYQSTPDVPVWAINAGGQDYTSLQGIYYSEDNFDVGRQSVITAAIANTSDDALYQTEAWGFGSFTYELPVSSGKYRVKLHFAEIYNDISDSGERVFDVSLEGQKVLSSLDIYAEVGFRTALIKEFEISVNDGGLTLNAQSSKQNPQISAIEVWRSDNK